MKSVVADYRYRVLCLRIVPTSGPVIRLTHHPRPLTMGNGQIYLSGSGYDFTGYTAGSNLSAAMVDLEGIAGIAGITRDQLADGRYDNARAYLFATTWKTPVEDEEPIVASILGKTTLLDARYKIEEMALTDALSQSVGMTVTPTCQKVFGGQEYAGCGVDLGPLTVSGTITSVTSNTVFRDSSRSEAADYFTIGFLTFSSGDNAGLPGKEVKAYAADGTLTLFEPFHYPVQIGDAYTLTPGCRHRLQDCQAWNNVPNFGGFSFILTSTGYAQVGTK